MLDSLRPNHDDDVDGEEAEVGNPIPASYHHERPQFVLGPDVDDEENYAQAGWRSEAERLEANQAGKDGSKGWKEVA